MKNIEKEEDIYINNILVCQISKKNQLKVKIKP